MTAATASVFASDVESVEQHEANLGTVATAVLSDGVRSVVGILDGASLETSLMDSGESPRMTDNFTVRRSQFTTIGAEPFKDGDTITINNRVWMVRSRTEPDVTIYGFNLVQSW